MSRHDFHLAIDTAARDGVSVTISDGSGPPLVSVTRTSLHRALTAADDQLADAIERTDAVESELAAVALGGWRARSELASVPESSVPDRDRGRNGSAEGRPAPARNLTAIAEVTQGGKVRDSAAEPLHRRRG